MKRGRKPGTPKSGGRKKGSKNKVPGEVKAMILQALANKGGVAYLEEQADKSPTAFLALVGKVLPLQVTGGDGQPLIPPSVTFIVRQQDGAHNRT